MVFLLAYSPACWYCPVIWIFSCLYFSIYPFALSSMPISISNSPISFPLSSIAVRPNPLKFSIMNSSRLSFYTHDEWHIPCLFFLVHTSYSRWYFVQLWWQRKFIYFAYLLKTTLRVRALPIHQPIYQLFTLLVYFYKDCWIYLFGWIHCVYWYRVIQI